MNAHTHTQGPMLTEPTRRVILVGRTGLDQQLRTEPDTEIVRAADSLGAIGELSDPPPGLDQADPIVIVGALPISPDPSGDATQLIDALRLVDPRVRVLAAPGAADPEVYDSVLDPDSSTADLLDSIRDAAPREHPEPDLPEPEKPDPDVHASDETQAEPSPDPQSEPDPPLEEARIAPTGSAFGPPIGPTHPKQSLGTDSLEDDAAMISELTRGRSLRGTALAIITRRLGVAPELQKTEPDQGRGVPVRVGDQPVAWLTVPGGVSLERLEAQARWLEHWMRLEHQQRELRTAAFTDHLTGAWNRRYFDRYLTATFEQARRSRLPVTVMVFDIDHFKTYNDRFGHAAGDEILRETVELLRSCIRPSDRVCRIGGDEFAVIFYEPDGPRSKGSAHPISIYTIATRFQRQICEHRFPKLGHQLHDTLTVSGGLATFPWDGATPEELLTKADELSLESKRAGKNALTLGKGAQRVCRVEFPETDSD